MLSQVKKGRFIGTILRDRLKKIREERQEKILKEGYQTRKRESEAISKDFLNIDLELRFDFLFFSVPAPLQNKNYLKLNSIRYNIRKKI